MRVQLLERLRGDVAGDEGEIREVTARQAYALQKADMAVALSDEPGETLSIDQLSGMVADEAEAALKIAEAGESETVDGMITPDTPLGTVLWVKDGYPYRLDERAGDEILLRHGVDYVAGIHTTIAKWNEQFAPNVVSVIPPDENESQS